MEQTAYLRRQAEYCLQLSRLYVDEPMTDELRTLAAEFHTRALRAEYEAEVADDCAAISTQ